MIKEKNPYIPPELIVHGDIEKITRETGTLGDDGYTGSESLPGGDF
jgi:hypothetical protein